MTKIIAVLLGIFLSLVGIGCLFFVNQSATMFGVVLPFGWEGPHFWITTETPNDHSSGLPFAMVEYRKNESAYYSNNLAVGLNLILSACTLPAVVFTIFKFKHRWRRRASKIA